MSALTIPNTFVANTVAASAQVNANFTAVAAVINGNIDHSNTVSSTGFYASDIKPLTAGEATFGATATGVGYKFLANDATAVPLTVSGVSAMTADIFDVSLTSGGTKALFVTASGHLNFGAIGTAGADASSAYISGDLGATIGMLLNVPAASTNGFQFSAGNLSIFTVDKNGTTKWANAGSAVLPNSPSIIGGASGALNFNATGGQGFFFSSGSGAATALGNINASTGNYTATSDERLKENVADLELGLDALLQLRPVTFDWISTKEPGQGFIAQAVQAVIPLAVSRVHEERDTLGISDAVLTPVIVKSIQQLAARIERLESSR